MSQNNLNSRKEKGDRNEKKNKNVIHCVRNPYLSNSNIFYNRL